MLVATTNVGMFFQNAGQFYITQAKPNFRKSFFISVDIYPVSRAEFVRMKKPGIVNAGVACFCFAIISESCSLYF